VIIIAFSIIVQIQLIFLQLLNKADSRLFRTTLQASENTL